jgi:hydroxymethylglutaryl-CoA lyase
VRIVDVAPRDGLQSEVVVLSTETKIELIDRLVDAGIRRVEAVSFARPDRVPQMADAEALMEGLPRNDRVDENNGVVVATDTSSGRNQNTTTEGALAAWDAISGTAAAAAEWLGAQLGRSVPGLLSRAGPFPSAPEPTATGWPQDGDHTE